MTPLAQFRTLPQGKSSAVGENSSLQSLHRLPVSPRSSVGISPTLGLNEMSRSQRYAQMARGLRSPLPSTCRWLTPEDLDLTSEQPIAAGEFANIWEAAYDGRKVVLKSHRCCTSIDVAQVVGRFHNEVHTWTLLHRGGVDIVPLVGVCSTEAHPFALVYEHLDGLDLRQYLRSQPNASRTKLLAGVAQILNRMHNLEIVHGNIQTSNILIDKDGTARIAGLGNVSTLPHSSVLTAGCTASTNRLSRNRAPELALPGLSRSPTDPTHPTKSSDMYAFGIMTWEVLTGRPPFSEMTEIAATYSMLSGARPSRPNYHEISDQMWYLIEQCWDSVPSRRLSVGEAAGILEKELGRTSASCTSSRTRSQAE